jgi:TM2 domain-containing membrane protein YozV
VSPDRSLRLGPAAWPRLFLAVVLPCAALTNASSASVTVPLAVGLVTALLFFMALWRRQYGVMPWFELGAVYVTVVTLYMAYPLTGFLVLGQTYPPNSDGRLSSLQPDSVEVGRAAWLYACHLTAFAVSYLLVRGRLVMQERRLRLPAPAVFMAVAGVYGVIALFTLFVLLFFDMTASTYAESYLVARRLPLIVGQLLNHLSGAKYPLALMLLAALFARYEKYRFVILAWLLIVAAITLVRLGSRTELVVMLLATGMMYHLVVRPLPARLVVGIGIAGLAGFMALGVLRQAQGGPTLLLAVNPFLHGSEFQTLFANAVHLARVKDTIGDLPLTFHLADFTALVPQQVAPFTKVSRADWYVTTFFPAYAAGGGGLAFGTIPEAILMGGWLAAIALGAALGFTFAKIHRFYARHSDRFWIFVFYVWITTLSYLAFRSSTFALLVLLVYQFVPALLVVNILGQGLKRLGIRTYRDVPELAPSLR